MADVMGTAIRKQAMPTHGGQELPAIGVVDPASDMWAIGVIAWALFTGQPLFPSSTRDVDVVSMLMGTKLLPFEQDPGMWMQFEKAQVGCSQEMQGWCVHACMYARVRARVRACMHVCKTVSCFVHQVQIWQDTIFVH